MVDEGVGSGRGEGRNFETPIKTMVVKSCGVQKATGKRPGSGRRRVSSHGDRESFSSEMGQKQALEVV